MRLFIATSLLMATVSGFSVAPMSPRRLSLSEASPLKMSEPSDTSSDDDYVIVDAEDYVPTAEEALVSNVLDLLPSQLGEVSSEARSAINEALYKLEALNPTKAPTMSPLLNGVWELRYVGGYAPDWALPSPTRQLALFLYSGGYSPGIFALQLAQKLPTALCQVGDLEIAIQRDQPRVEASIGVKLLGGGSESSVQVNARLEVESDVRLRETYESATVLGRQVEIPKQLQYQREMYVTFCDDELLVVRDGSGVPEVLVRKTKSFSQNWGTEPSALEDMVPPGEE